MSQKGLPPTRGRAPKKILNMTPPVDGALTRMKLTSDGWNFGELYLKSLPVTLKTFVLNFLPIQLKQKTKQ